MMGWLVWEINLSNGWQIYWTWTFMRISFQQILLEHAPKGKLLYHYGICEPLQFCNEVFREQYWNKLNSSEDPHFPSSVTDLSCRGWQWKSFILGTRKPQQNWRPLFPSLDGREDALEPHLWEPQTSHWAPSLGLQWEYGNMGLALPGTPWFAFCNLGTWLRKIL